jgi:hypothetical protein
VLFGAFGGFEPDQNLGFSQDKHDFGSYLQLHSAPGSRTTLSWSLGAVGRYLKSGTADEEFGFTQLSVSSRYFSLYVLEQGNHYRKFLRDSLGKPSFELTSSYLSGSIRPSRAVQFTGSYDNRTTIPLFRDAVNPETAFDDAHREGYGGGIALFGRRVRASGDYHHSSGGTAGSNDAITATAGIDRLTSVRLSFLGRGTWIKSNSSTSGNLTGHLYSVRIGVDPLEPLHFDADLGIRKDASPGEPVTKWLGVSMDLSLARAWFLSGSAVKEKGTSATTGNTTSNQFYASLTWRF